MKKQIKVTPLKKPKNGGDILRAAFIFVYGKRIDVKEELKQFDGDSTKRVAWAYQMLEKGAMIEA